MLNTCLAKVATREGRVKVSYIAKNYITLVLYKSWCPLRTLSRHLLRVNKTYELSHGVRAGSLEDVGHFNTLLHV